MESGIDDVPPERVAPQCATSFYAAIRGRPDKWLNLSLRGWRAGLQPGRFPVLWLRWCLVGLLHFAVGRVEEHHSHRDERAKSNQRHKKDRHTSPRLSVCFYRRTDCGDANHRYRYAPHRLTELPSRPSGFQQAVESTVLVHASNSGVDSLFLPE